MKKTSLILILILFLILLALPVVWPFFHSGYFPTHDGEWAVARLSEMDREVRDGQFPPRWADYLNHSYGYPLFLFTYPLPYYLGEIFHLFGLGLVNSVKTVFVLSVIFSGIAMFFLGKKLWGLGGGLLSTIFYLYFPFRMVDLYVRGSVGESLALVFFPLLFLLGISLVEKPTQLKIVVTGISLAALILTHNALALAFIPFWLAYIFVFILRQKNLFTIYYLLFTILLGFSLSAYFWLPAVWEKKYIILSQIPLADFRQHFVSLKSLILPSWSYDALPSFQVGWVHLAALVLVLILFFLKRIQDDFLILRFSIVAFLILVFLMLPPSLPFWQNAPLFKNFDFPWRLLGLTGFFISLASGFLALGKSGKFLVFFLAILVIVFNLPYAQPRKFVNRGDDFYRSNDATTTSADELMPVWVKTKPQKRPSQKVEILEGPKTAQVENLSYNSWKLSFSAKAEEKLKVQINTIYFPGWQVFVDEQPNEFKYDNPYGVIVLSVPSGNHSVEAKFTRTPIRWASDLISLLSGLAAFGLLVSCIRLKRS